MWSWMLNVERRFTFYSIVIECLGSDANAAPGKIAPKWLFLFLEERTQVRPTDVTPWAEIGALGLTQLQQARPLRPARDPDGGVSNERIRNHNSVLSKKPWMSKRSNRSQSFTPMTPNESSPSCIYVYKRTSTTGVRPFPVERWFTAPILLFLLVAQIIETSRRVGMQLAMTWCHLFSSVDSLQVLC